MATNNLLSRATGMINALLNPNQVGYLIFYVTNQCNFRCNFCFYGSEIAKGYKPDLLALDEIDRMARSVGPLLQLSLTGGEPFVRKDFAQITKILLKHTISRFVTIVTNASMPERMVSYLEEVLPLFPHSYFRLVFSIEGIGSEHDMLRSMPGSYEKIQKSYSLISPMRERFNNLTLDCNSVFTAASENTLLNTLKHLDNEFDFDNISVTFARGEMEDTGLKETSPARYLEINTFLESLDRRKEKRFLYPLWRGVRDVSRDILMQTVFDNRYVVPCVAGRKLLIVSETGEVLPCEVLGKSMGNLRNYGFDINRLLSEEINRDLKKWIVQSKCKCSFECALAANVVWNPSTYKKLASATARNIGTRSKDNVSVGVS